MYFAQAGQAWRCWYGVCSPKGRVSIAARSPTDVGEQGLLRGCSRHEGNAQAIGDGTLGYVIVGPGGGPGLPKDRGAARPRDALTQGRVHPRGAPPAAADLCVCHRDAPAASGTHVYNDRPSAQADNRLRNGHPSAGETPPYQSTQADYASRQGTHLRTDYGALPASGMRNGNPMPTVTKPYRSHAPGIIPSEPVAGQV